MGFSVTWVAARGKSRDRVLQDLNLEGADEWEETPESPVVGAQLPGGWYGVILNQEITSLFEGDTLKRLSTGAEVVVCTVEEHVMTSGAFGWKNGQEIWSVLRAPQMAPDGVTTVGKVPRPLAAIEKELRAKQKAADNGEPGYKRGVDYLFDIPVELAKALTGYRYDREIPGVTGAQFEVLALRKKAGRYYTSWGR